MCERLSATAVEFLGHQHHQRHRPEYRRQGEDDRTERLWCGCQYLVTDLRVPCGKRLLLTIKHASRQKASGTHAALMPQPPASGSCQILQHRTSVNPRNHTMLQVTKHFNDDRSSSPIFVGCGHRWLCVGDISNAGVRWSGYWGLGVHIDVHDPEA